MGNHKKNRKNPWKPRKISKFSDKNEKLKFIKNCNFKLIFRKLMSTSQSHYGEKN